MVCLPVSYYLDIIHQLWPVQPPLAVWEWPMSGAVIGISSAHTAPHSQYTSHQDARDVLVLACTFQNTRISPALSAQAHLDFCHSSMTCGLVQSSESNSWDEVMVVAYKSRWQFFQMALLTPSYWPLS